MSEKVHVTVIKGSVGTWKDGSFKKGETFETTREEAMRIDPSFIQILEDLPPIEPEPQPVAEQPIVEEPTIAISEVSSEKTMQKRKPKKAEADA